jgi:phosphoglycerol transferase MdoB-like AlkP superfamily enzyme
MRIRFFLKFFIYAFFALFIYHIAFFLKYFEFKDLNFQLLKQVAFVTLRFDLATLAYFTMPILLLMFIPISEKKIFYFRAVFVLAYFWLLFFVIYLFIDLIYYQFSLRHLSFEILNATGEIVPLLKIAINKYIFEISILMIFIVLFTVHYVNVFKKNYTKSKIAGVVLNVASFIILAGLLVLLSRGGLQMKPMKLGDAFVFENPSLGHLCLNGFYTTMKTVYEIKIKKNKLKYGKYNCIKDSVTKIKNMFFVDGEVGADSEYPILRRFNYKKGDFKKMNVVVFVMESWSGKFCKATDGDIDATPFFTKLSKKGLLLKRFFANGQRSIEGISAIVTSIPPWGGLIVSENPLLAQLHTNFLPAILKKHGYETIFIHGAKYGSLGLNSFAKHVGFNKYISKEDIAKMGGKDDGVWGIYDEDTFLIANDIFEKEKKPFFALIFSLSSHTPYKVPSKKFLVFEKDQPHADFLNALFYSDYALSKFFERAEKSSYFKNTIFVILGDHTEGKTTKRSIFERFQVPCLIYAPNIIKPGEINISTSQLDIVPTLLDLLKSSDYHASFGCSVLRKRNNIGAILAYGDFAVYNKGEYFLMISDEKPLGLYQYKNVKDEDIDRSNEKKDVYKSLKEEFSCLGYFINKMLVENKLYKSKQNN